ncbi:MAG: 8-amino-7-oxononanoate synthase, partial [uncultured Solirubrobacteraceae bacterium]
AGPPAAGRGAVGARAAPSPAGDREPTGRSRDPRRPLGPAAVLQRLPRARRPSPRPRGRGRGGAALGRGRRRIAPGVGQHGRPRPARAAPGRLQGHRGGTAGRLGLPGQPGRHRRARRTRRGRVLRRAQSRLDRRRLPALKGRDLRLPPRRPRPSRVGPAPGREAGCADRHRRDLLDGRRRRAAGRAGRDRAPSWRPARRRRRARHRHDRRGRARLGGVGGPRGRGRRDRRHAGQGARLLRRLRRLRRDSVGVPGQHHAPADLLDRPSPVGGRRRRSRSGAGGVRARPRRAAPGQRGAHAAGAEEPGRRGRGGRCPHHPAARGRGGRDHARLRGGPVSRLLRPGHKAADRSARDLAAAADRDGDALPHRADARRRCAGRRACSPAGRRGRGHRL